MPARNPHIPNRRSITSYLHNSSIGTVLVTNYKLVWDIKFVRSVHKIISGRMMSDEYRATNTIIQRLSNNTISLLDERSYKDC